MTDFYVPASIDEVEGRGNDKFSSANIAWTILGGLLWCLVIYGLFLPEA